MSTSSWPTAARTELRPASVRATADPGDGLLLISDAELSACRVPAFLATYRPARLTLGDPGLHHHGAARATEALADALVHRRRGSVHALMSRSGAAVEVRLPNGPDGLSAEVTGIDVVRVAERSAAVADVDALLRAGGRVSALRLLWGYEDDAGRAVIPCLEPGVWRLRTWGVRLQRPGLGRAVHEGASEPSSR